MRDYEADEIEDRAATMVFEMFEEWAKRHPGGTVTEAIADVRRWHAEQIQAARLAELEI